MDQLPPPPDRPDLPFGDLGTPGSTMPSPLAGPARRPGVVTAAACALIVVGALTLLAVLLISSLNIDASIVAAVIVIALLVGAGNLLAGVLVLRLSPAGRTLGFIFAGLGLFGSVVQLGQNPGSSIVMLVVDGFVIWALATNRDAFRFGPRG
jgi:hypothetical protein